jgi:hypothetical protein
MESANNDARKWPILPFDVSRDFILGTGYDYLDYVTRIIQSLYYALR